MKTRSPVRRLLCRLLGHDWSVHDVVATLSAVSSELRGFECWCDRCGIKGRADWRRDSGVRNFREEEPNVKDNDS